MVPRVQHPIFAIMGGWWEQHLLYILTCYLLDDHTHTIIMNLKHQFHLCTDMRDPVGGITGSPSLLMWLIQYQNTAIERLMCR